MTVQNMFVYCLFCQTERTEYVAGEIERRGVHRAFSPTIVKRQRVKGENKDVTYRLFPGYVFVYSETELNTSAEFKEIRGIIRHLGNVEDNFLLKGADLDFAMRLYQKDGMVGQVTVFKEGDNVRIDDPMWKGIKATITRIDYKKERARVEFNFAGTKCSTWVAISLIEGKV